ncbi:MAG: 2-oxoacid:acceptor oxidoreductase family protein [Clostridioides sp.]|jgi:2-oxoglutarate ferredoxin oxidoreductase subunit gamma|nr:2-oxoacid:acceptor oxidoreductase family protein [Clostridioides sp.]
MATSKVICAGFGGQGVMSMGQLLTYAGMMLEKEVSWLPSYGPEMRGGTAMCAVTVSDEPVGSPLITDDATAAIVMNAPSFEKYQSSVAPGGYMFINSSLIDAKGTRDDVKYYYIPANEIAAEVNNPKAANLVMLGAFLAIDPVVDTDTVLKAFLKVFGANKEKFIPANRAALEKGAETVKDIVK